VFVWVGVGWETPALSAPPPPPHPHIKPELVEL
jgi:hypothetical protein